uniref:Uncharacterized protein n=1 Tax=Arundo donax TaxID=35708 RepID=A0A0A9CRB7_ARUDO
MILTFLYDEKTFSSFSSVLFLGKRRVLCLLVPLAVEHLEL